MDIYKLQELINSGGIVCQYYNGILISGKSLKVYCNKGGGCIAECNSFNCVKPNKLRDMERYHEYLYSWYGMIKDNRKILQNVSIMPVIRNV